MPEYQWRGLTAQKQKQRGRLIAENANQARHILLSRGITHIKLQRNWQFSRQPTIHENYEFLLQFSLLLQANLTLLQCLQLLKQNCTQLMLHQHLNEWICHLGKGISFSQAIKQTPFLFNAQDVQLIKSAELTGDLSTVIANLARNKQSYALLQQKIRKILLYPLIILAISTVLTLLLLWFIVPQFAELYQKNSADLPLITQWLMWLSHLLQQHIFLILCAIFSISFIGKKLLNHSTHWRYTLLRICFIIPVVKQIYQQNLLTHFSSSLSLMLQAGIPLQQAIASFTTNDKHSTNLLNKELQQTIQLLQQGYRFSEALGGELFSQYIKQMIAIGEKSGHLPEILQHLAEQYKNQLNRKIDLFAQFLEPILMLIIGSIIGFVMLGMYLPIFNLGNILV